MFPPLIPIFCCARRIKLQSPTRIPAIINIPNTYNRANISLFQTLKNSPSIAFPNFTTFSRPPIIATVGWICHHFIPMCPINYLGICLDLLNRRQPVFTIIVFWFPSRHPAVNPVCINSQILQIFEVKIDISLDSTDVASANTRSSAGEFNCFDVLSKNCDRAAQLKDQGS